MSTTASALPKFAFSKNPINAVISSDDYVDVLGINAITKFIVTGAIANGNTIHLLWSKGDVTLTAAAVPDNSGAQIPSGVGDEANVRAIMAAMQTNYYIDRDFDLSYSLIGGLPGIFLNARNAGALYNISSVTTAHITVTTDTLGVNLQYKPNFQHHLEIWAKLGENFQIVFAENLQLDLPVNGQTTKDLSEILNAWLKEASDKPDLTATNWQLCPNSLIEYYIKYGQYYGDTPTVKKTGVSASSFVNLGGLGVIASQGQTLSAYLRPDDDDSKTLCLRQGSKNILLGANQPEFLYWINLTGADVNVKLSIELFFTDNSASIHYYILPFTATANKKYYVPVNVDLLGVMFNIPTGKTCSYYTVRICDDTGRYLSAAYNYQLDDYREWPRYLIFRNSLGGFQTLYTWGKGQPEVTRAKEEVKKLATNPETAENGMFYENNIRLQAKKTVYTGYRSQRDIMLLNDFLASDEKYEVSGSQLIPIGVDTSSLKFAQDGDNLNGQAITYYPLFDDIVYTDDKSQADNLIPGLNGSGSQPQGFNTIWDDGNNTDNIAYTDI